MMFHPGIVALLLGSALTSSMLCYSASIGWRIIRNWDIGSGSEVQLELERRTYLISTAMTYALAFQLFSLFLFIHTADTLSPLFVGAMCAAGSLKVNGFGYPTLMLKIGNCLFAGLWLIINSADNKGYDYPLIRIKYGLLLFITPFLIIETITQGMYLLNLKPNIITSCCATLFSTGAGTVMSDLLELPRRLSQIAYFSIAPITLALGLYVYLRTKGAILFSSASLVNFILSLVALISFISIYMYELPTHHCPFCILHQEYGYVGYLLYVTPLLSAIFGIGTGIINPFRTITSLQNVIPPLQRRLALISIISSAAFLLIAGSGILFSDLSMAQY